MRSKLLLLIICSVAQAWPASSAQAEREYVDKANGFKITLIGKWKPSEYMDVAGRRRTEFVWEERSQGLLRIARQNLSGRSLEDVVRNEIEALKLNYACMFTGQEPFSTGEMSGARLSLYYFEGGRRKIGVYYFLRDKDAVWVLRFSGDSGSAAVGHDNTDAVARTLCSMCAL